MDKAKKNIIDVLAENMPCASCPIVDECEDVEGGFKDCEEMFSKFLFNEPYDSGDEEEEREEESFADYVCRRFVEDFIGETLVSRKENTTKVDEKQNREIIVTIGEMEIKGLPKDVAMLIREVNANGGI